jgi:tight adherence protein C
MQALIFIGVLGGVALMLWGALTVRQVEDTMTARLQRFDLRPARSLRELELQIPRSERILGPPRRYLAGWVRRMTPGGTIEKAQSKLAQAGNPNNLTVQDFLGIKGMAAVSVAALVFLMVTFFVHVGFTLFVLFIVVGLVVGFNLPSFWLNNKIKKRQQEIRKFLPDAIDILAISVQAGQGFDGALATLAARKQNALTYEFDRFRLETQAGKGRREALRDLAIRTDVEDLKLFAAAMIQADQLGIGVAQVLKSQSEELRIRRRQRAEEEAEKAPIKMLFPLIFLMFPSLFIVILGPAVPKLMFMGHTG